MLPIAYYFLQVVLCSAMMMGYYWLVLRNKRFHQYNRFYLLAIALLSWIVPLLKIKWGHAATVTDPRVMQFLSVVADNNSQIEETITRKGFQWNWEMVAGWFYIAVSAVLLLALVYALIRIYKLLSEHSCKNVGDVYLILTQAKGTPFSFFRYIFWNEEIDIRSDAGKQILQHELTHVQQKHSIDKIFIQLILVAGWFNPFFWLLKKEMEMIHEFIADRKAVNDGDTASLAQMLLTAAYPKQPFALTHPFFFSPIKRRLQMLTNTKHPRFSYLRRLVVLPLLALVVVLFAFRNKEKANVTLSVAAVVENMVDRINDLNHNPTNAAAGIELALLNRKYTVVIDAGHGGKDKGEIAADGTTESALTLQLAKTIRDLNENEHIHILLRRDKDVFDNEATIADKVNQQNPDLYLTIHINNSSPAKAGNGKTKESASGGILLLVPDKAKAADYNGSVALANYINTSVTSLREKMLGIKTREKGGWVLNNVKTPAVLLEAGFINNEADLKKLKDAGYQQKMAAAVLQGINYYLSKPAQNKLNLDKLGLDTIVIKGKATAAESKLVLRGVQNTSLQNVLLILDGKKVDNSLLQTLNPDQIESVSVLKNESAVAVYGEEGKNGVILISSKKTNQHKVNLNLVSKLALTDQPVVLKSRNETDSLVWIAQNGDESLASKQPLYIVDGERATLQTASISPSDIKSINILKDKTALDKYGPDARNGVVEIITKQKLTDLKLEEVVVTDYNDIDPTGIKALKKRNPAIKHAYLLMSPHTLTVELKNGAKEVYDLWIASDRQKAENKYGKLPAVPDPPVSVENIRLEKTIPVFSETQIPPEFPGGMLAWANYLQRNQRKNIVKENGGPPGKYTVPVSFIIDKSGNVSDVHAESDPGYGTKEEAIRLISTGPRWKPAVQNGQTVIYRHKLSIRFFVAENGKEIPRAGKQKK